MRLNRRPPNGIAGGVGGRLAAMRSASYPITGTVVTVPFESSAAGAAI